MASIQFSCKLAAFFILMALFLGWQHVYTLYSAAFQQDHIHAWGIFFVAIATLFCVLNVVSAVGLFLIKHWVFWLSYIAIVFSTIFFSATYVPFIHAIGMHFLPVTARPFFPLIVNALLMFYIVYLHIVFKRRHMAHNTSNFSPYSG